MSNRWDVMIEVLKDGPHKRGAEIGIFKGLNAYHLLEGLPELNTLYCNDRWDFYPECPRIEGEDEPFESVREDFFDRLLPFRHRIIILWMDSLEAAQHIEDESLDFIFIDANHKYEFVINNAKVWTPKVKIGGIISGHDYGYGKKRGFGVKEAVNDYFGKKNINLGDDHTWWLIKERL